MTAQHGAVPPEQSAIAAMGRAFRDWYKARTGRPVPDGRKVTILVRESDGTIGVELLAPIDADRKILVKEEDGKIDIDLVAADADQPKGEDDD